MHEGGRVSNIVIAKEEYTAKLEEALDEVTSGSGAEASGKDGNTLIGNDRAEGRDHALIVLGGVELHARPATGDENTRRVQWRQSEERAKGKGKEAHLTTSTGQTAPCVMEQQMPPAKAALR